MWEGWTWQCLLSRCLWCTWVFYYGMGIIENFQLIESCEDHWYISESLSMYLFPDKLKVLLFYCHGWNVSTAMHRICTPVRNALTDNRISSPRDDQRCFVITRGPMHAPGKYKIMPRPCPTHWSSSSPSWTFAWLHCNKNPNCNSVPVSFLSSPATWCP